MSYEDILQKGEICNLPRLDLEWKFVRDTQNIEYPILFCEQRADRPYRNYKQYARMDCPLCQRIARNDTRADIVKGMEWMPATWPIKSLHSLCFPRDHRAGILAKDICRLGDFSDQSGDVVVCINMHGSAASIPEHFHAQLHDGTLPGWAIGSLFKAFPLLSRPQVLLERGRLLSVLQIKDYPAFAFVLEGHWRVLGEWLERYLAACNVRPHNFALVPNGRLIVIPRGVERVEGQENAYGCIEMLGMIAPITREAYDAIDSGDVIEDALHLSGCAHPTLQSALIEHALWAKKYVEHL